MKRFLLFPLAALLLAFAAPARAEGGLVTECTFVVPAGLSLVSVPFVKLDGSAFAFGETAFATNLPAGSTVRFWNAKNSSYFSGERYDDGWEPAVSNYVLAVGEGFWIQSTSANNSEIWKAVRPRPAPPSIVGIEISTASQTPSLMSFTIAFSANGGKGKMAAEAMTYGKAKKLSANKFKRKGYVFKGWAKSAKLAKQGKVAYKNKKSVKNLTTTGKTVKLYAVWEKK